MVATRLMGIHALSSFASLVAAYEPQYYLFKAALAHMRKKEERINAQIKLGEDERMKFETSSGIMNKKINVSLMIFGFKGTLE